MSFPVTNISEQVLNRWCQQGTSLGPAGPIASLWPILEYFHLIMCSTFAWYETPRCSHVTLWYFLLGCTWLRLLDDGVLGSGLELGPLLGCFANFCAWTIGFLTFYVYIHIMDFKAQVHHSNFDNPKWCVLFLLISNNQIRCFLYSSPQVSFYSHNKFIFNWSSMDYLEICWTT